MHKRFRFSSEKLSTLKITRLATAKASLLWQLVLKQASMLLKKIKPKILLNFVKVWTHFLQSQSHFYRLFNLELYIHVFGICDRVWQKGTYSLSDWATLCTYNFTIIRGISLKFSQTILLWCCNLVCKYHYYRPSKKYVMSSQSMKSGKAINPFGQIFSRAAKPKIKAPNLVYTTVAYFILDMVMQSQCFNLHAPMVL